MARPLGQFLRLRWDIDELERIKTIKAKTGMKHTAEVVRVALMKEYTRVTGSPTPSSKTD